MGGWAVWGTIEIHLRQRIVSTEILIGFSYIEPVLMRPVLRVLKWPVLGTGSLEVNCPVLAPMLGTYYISILLYKWSDQGVRGSLAPGADYVTSGHFT
jgi:hypothetical protein